MNEESHEALKPDVGVDWGIRTKTTVIEQLTDFLGDGAELERDLLRLLVWVQGLDPSYVTGDIMLDTPLGEVRLCDCEVRATLKMRSVEEG